MIIDYHLLGKRLAAVRAEKNISQAKLAEKADISNTYLSHIETSRSIPSLETLMALCTVLEITPDTLLMGTATNQDTYMVSDIHDKLAQCTPEEKRFVYMMIDTILKQHAK